jgi:hypothetical protein
MGANDGGINHQPFRVGLDRQGIEHHLPDPCFRPPSEPLVDPRPPPVHAGQCAPGRTRTTDPHHGFDTAPIIARAAHIAGFAGKRLVDLPPLILYKYFA